VLVESAWAAVRHQGFRFVADLAWRRQGPGVQVLEGNLRRVIANGAPGGQLRGLSRQVMRSYARYWLEAFRLPVTPAARLLGRMHVTGHVRAISDYPAAGRGVILALPHRAHPQDWHMLQRVFVADLDPGRLRRAAAS
jgi:lauroyl/myristoyl acyltransferase